MVELLSCFWVLNQNKTIFFEGYAGKISQMPIILTPLHFDRDPLQKQPSCQRSVVIRTFITSDFMTGIAATPGNEIPEEVIQIRVFKFLSERSGAVGDLFCLSSFLDCLS